MKSSSILLSLLFAGCQLNTVSGLSIAGSGTSGGAATATSSGTARATTGGQRSTGAATSGGMATTGGTDSGGGESTSGVAEGTTGGAAATGGSTTGGTCLPPGAQCKHGSDCCTKACNGGSCAEPVGAGCLLPNDCSSGVCTDQVCACSPDGCATDADCCNGKCDTAAYPGIGICCGQVGDSCASSECCGSNCVDGGCVCWGLDYDCLDDSDCCAGKCTEVRFGFGNTVSSQYRRCLGGSGQACDSSSQCYTSGCVDGGCSSCDGPPSGYWVRNCLTDADCCSGLVCSTYLLPVSENEDFAEAYDAGSSCCAPTGAFCDGGIDCCSGTCTARSCACATVTGSCVNERGCCSGACLPSVFHQLSSYYSLLACCQTNGQVCYDNNECCTGFCQQDHQCACVATGGACGPEGQFAALGSQACCSGQCSDAGSCQ